MNIDEGNTFQVNDDRLMKNNHEFELFIVFSNRNFKFNLQEKCSISLM